MKDIRLRSFTVIQRHPAVTEGDKQPGSTCLQTVFSYLSVVMSHAHHGNQATHFKRQHWLYMLTPQSAGLLET